MDIIQKTGGTLSLLGAKLDIFEGNYLHLKEASIALKSTPQSIKNNAFEGAVCIHTYEDEFYPKTAAFVSLAGIYAFIERTKNKYVSPHRDALLHKLADLINPKTI